MGRFYLVSLAIPLDQRRFRAVGLKNKNGLVHVAATT
jgi:hypothetical protein